MEKKYAYPVVTGKKEVRVGWMNLESKLMADEPAVAQYLDENLLGEIEKQTVYLDKFVSRNDESFLVIRASHDKSIVAWFNAENETVDVDKVASDLSKGVAKIERFKLGHDYSSLYAHFGIPEPTDEAPF